MLAITKKQLRAALGGPANDAEISRFFGISQAAVSQWGEDDPIPERRALAAVFKRPDLFGRFASLPANDDTAPAEGEGASNG
ncbi:hypothetical protein QF205_10850 [Luteimonas composti]|uniref:Helix-turn-helix domain-containing protein n=1 Tax=Luteimonas composti TaxID=398257 RepID=A0ABT6MT03_9GAMM|nr:hypothetical protein [Luteimonas composti]MDH7453560.1 hypothetical protein [Luteimonas composti]